MILEASRRNRSNVVLALDVIGPLEQRLVRAKEVLQKSKGLTAAVKINQQLLLPFGLQGLEGVLEICKEEGVPLIADIKMNDIESTNIDVIRSLLASGFDAVIANPFVGLQEGLGGVIEMLHRGGQGLILLVYMSHRGAEEGYGLRLAGGEELYLTFARRARDWGADGVVVSAKSPEKIERTREVVGDSCLIFSPGVGTQGGEAKVGATAGADFIIVGRSITEAPDPRKTLLEIRAASFP